MKQFMSFVKKEFRHIFRDTRTMMILLLMPIAQIILFGFAITTELRNVNVVVYDPSNDAASNRIINQINASEYFTVIKKIYSEQEVDALFKNGEANMAIIFSNHFNSNLLHTGNATVQLVVDATDPNQASSMSSYASSIINSYQQELMMNYKTPIQIIPQVKMLYNPSLKGSYNFVPGVMGMILMLICAMMTSISIVREKEMGTMEILLASPMKPLSIIMAKSIPYFVLSLVNIVTILLLSVFVLEVPIAGSLFWLFIISMVFILVALSLGILISTVSNTQVTAMMASGMGLMMPVMMLSGMMFPIESMPLVLRIISNIIPARWYIDAVKKIMIEGAPIQAVSSELFILCGMAVVLIGISLKNFKTRLE